MDDCLKLTSYFGERLRSGGRLYSDVLLDSFEEHEISRSILLRASGGFGQRHQLRTDETLSMSEDPSMMAVAVDTRPRIEALVTHVADLQPRGMLTVERARLIHDDVPGSAADPDEQAETKLTVYVGRHERSSGEPAYLRVCDVLRRHDVSGASVLVGVDGTQRGVRQRARFFGRNLDVPTMVLAVGPTDRINHALAELAPLLRRPTVTVERVRVCKRDGERLARPDEVPDADENGEAVWQKLMVYTSESHLHDGRPVHRALARRLRETRAAGVTSIRGAWGFHGDHEPHGDRLLQAGRRVPVVTIVVDTPSRIATSYAVIDELTSEHGLVTAELVPSMRYW